MELLKTEEIIHINLTLTAKGKLHGWGKLGKCELGDVNFTNEKYVSTRPLEEYYINSYFSYSVSFIPPTRKRSIQMFFYFNKIGKCTGVLINFGKGQFSAKNKKEWIDILKNWLIENGYAEEL